MAQASAAHRKVFYALAEKLGVRSSTVVLSGSEKRITLERPAGYVAKEWDSPFGPRSPQRKGNDKLPKGASQVLDFLWLGSGRDADDVDTLCTTGITHVLNVTAEWKESPELVLRRIEVRVPAARVGHVLLFAHVVRASFAASSSRILLPRR